MFRASWHNFLFFWFFVPSLASFGDKFLSAFKISFNESLLVESQQHLFVSESMFILPLKGVISEVRILGWQPFLFIQLKVSFYYLISSTVTVDKPVVSL